MFPRTRLHWNETGKIIVGRVELPTESQMMFEFLYANSGWEYSKASAGAFELEGK